MAKITRRGNPINTIGNLPIVGSKAPDFTLVLTDLNDTGLEDFLGQRIIMNIFPSLDTSTCAASVRRFNMEAQNLENTVVLCISMDLPYAHKRFCVAEGLENVISASGFRNPEFGKDYGITVIDGATRGLYSRAVIVIDENASIIYTQQVPEVTEEPDYEEVLLVVSG
jgi:thiol peroxidase